MPMSANSCAHRVGRPSGSTRRCHGVAHEPDYLGNHVRVSVTALALGLAVSLPLAILSRNRPVLRGALLGLASIVQTVPGLALYSMLPVLRNTITGLNGVGADLLEAAQGVGMTPRQSLVMVE